MTTTTPGPDPRLPHPGQESGRRLAEGDVRPLDTRTGTAPARSLPDSDIDAGHRMHTSAGHSGHGGHRLMMLVCCIPMVVVAVLVVVTGTVGAGVLIQALVCVATMAVMHLAGPGAHGHT